MKKFLTFLTVSLFLVISSLAFAEDWTGKFSFTPQAGINLPIGDYGDVAKLGPGFGGSFEYNLLPMFAIGGTFTYNINGASDDYQATLQTLYAGVTGDPNTTIDEVGSFKIWNFGVYGKYNIPTQSNVTPFLKLGLGVYGFTPGDITYTYTGGTVTEELESSTKLGINPGAGVSFLVSPNVNLTLQSNWHTIFTDNSSTNYVGFAGAVTIAFGGTGIR